MLAFALGGTIKATELRLGVIQVEGQDLMGTNIQEAGDILRTAYKNADGYKELSYQQTSVSGLPAIDFTFEATGTLPDGTKRAERERFVVVLGSSRTFFAVAGAFANTFESEAASVDHFFRSLTVS